MPDYVPPSEDQIKDKARDLTTQAEKGSSVTAELNKMPFDDRAKIAHQMEQYNKDDIEQQLTKTKLELKFEKDSGQQEHLTDMTAIKDPSAMIFKGKTEVYEMPKSGNAALDFITPKLTADIRDSEYLRNPDMMASLYHPEK